MEKAPKYLHEVPRDMVLIPVKEVLKPLTEQQEKFAQAYARGMSAQASARHAGYQKHGAEVWIFQKPQVVNRIHELRKHYEEQGKMTKKKVMDGFIEAIEIAKLKGEAQAMVSGWREIARMCGYFEPIKHKLEVDVSGKVIVQRLQGLSDAELLRLAEGESDVIDADFIEIDDSNRSLPAGQGPTDSGGELASSA